MTEEGWKKDEKPYLVFECHNCHEYSYVKTTQKTKKCLRCGKNHIVLRIMNTGFIVKGMSKAVECVKRKQEEKFGTSNLQSNSTFVPAMNLNKVESIGYHNISAKPDDNDGYYEQFKVMLTYLSELYKIFPRFMIELMAETKHVPLEEITFLINESVQKGFLIKTQTDYYRINKINS